MTLVNNPKSFKKCAYPLCNNMAVQHGYCSTDCAVKHSVAEEIGLDLVDAHPLNERVVSGKEMLKRQHESFVKSVLAEENIFVKHASGAVRSKDVDHLALDLLPSGALKEIAKVLKEGSLKYSPHNWRKGLSYRDTYNHLSNHLLNWIEGGSIEELSHAACNILFLLEFSIHPELYENLDDRFSHTQIKKETI